MSRTALESTSVFYQASPGIRLFRFVLAASQRLWPSLAVRAAYRLFGTPLPPKWLNRRSDWDATWRIERWPFEQAGVTVYSRPVAPHGPVVLLVHGWGGHARQMLPLAEALGQRGLRVALLYGPGEEGVATAVAGRLAKPPVLGPGKPLGLGGLKSVCSRLSVLVATDTGPRHVAVAFGVPVVVVMGPTDPRYTNCNLERTVVLREEVECAPYRWPCHEKDCPLTDTRRHQCMERIPADRAVRAAVDLMARFPR